MISEKDLIKNYNKPENIINVHLHHNKKNSVQILNKNEISQNPLSTLKVLTPIFKNYMKNECGKNLSYNI